MKRLVLLGVLLLAGCGASPTSVVTVTTPVAPSRSCSKVSDLIVLCERPAAQGYTTAFYVRRGERLSALHIGKPPGSKFGHWVTAFLSPDRKTLLAQWSAECEVPIAYFVPARGGVPRALTEENDESLAHGWTSDGRAIVEFPHGPCGGGASRPGLYLVSLDGTRRLLTAAQ